jgi:hypothetical protein
MLQTILTLSISSRSLSSHSLAHRPFVSRQIQAQCLKREFFHPTITTIQAAVVASVVITMAIRRMRAPCPPKIINSNGILM